MPRPANWTQTGVPDGVPFYLTEGELTRALGLSSYAGYRLRRLEVIKPVAMTAKQRLYTVDQLDQLASYRVIIEGERSYLKLPDGRTVF